MSLQKKKTRRRGKVRRPLGKCRILFLGLKKKFAPLGDSVVAKKEEGFSPGRVLGAKGAPKRDAPEAPSNVIPRSKKWNWSQEIFEMGKKGLRLGNARGGSQVGCRGRGIGTLIKDPGWSDGEKSRSTIRQEKRIGGTKGKKKRSQPALASTISGFGGKKKVFTRGTKRKNDLHRRSANPS